jgi:hypothetical protein
MDRDRLACGPWLRHGDKGAGTGTFGCRGWQVSQRVISSAWDTTAPISLTGDEALVAGCEGADNVGIREAREFLADMLTDGPMPTAPITPPSLGGNIGEAVVDAAA